MNFYCFKVYYYIHTYKVHQYM